MISCESGVAAWQQYSTSVQWRALPLDEWTEARLPLMVQNDSASIGMECRDMKQQLRNTSTILTEQLTVDFWWNPETTARGDFAFLMISSGGTLFHYWWKHWDSWEFWSQCFVIHPHAIRLCSDKKRILRILSHRSRYEPPFKQEVLESNTDSLVKYIDCILYTISYCNTLSSLILMSDNVCYIYILTHLKIKDNSWYTVLPNLSKTFKRSRERCQQIKRHHQHNKCWNFR